MNLLNDIPSIPKIPSVAPLHLGITTRVMAKRLALQREKDKNLEKNADENIKPGKEVQNRRRSSRFLEGAAIPNSVIKADLQTPEPQKKDKATTTRERDEFVEKVILKRLQPQKKMHHSIYDEDIDREALDKIKKELQRKSLLPLTRDKDQDKKSLSMGTASTTKSIKDPWEELKEKRRISRRTSILAPLGGERRSTYDSIKKAIQTSKVIQQLLDADKIEDQKIKEIQMEKPSTEAHETVPESQSSKEKLTMQGSSTKGLKKEGPKNGKERKGSKRKSSLKSEKSLLMADVEKPLVKSKASNDSKKFLKRSASKLLKEDLEKRSSIIINNTRRQRKSSSH